MRLVVLPMPLWVQRDSSNDTRTTTDGCAVHRRPPTVPGCAVPLLHAQERAALGIEKPTCHMPSQSQAQECGHPDWAYSTARFNNSCNCTHAMQNIALRVITWPRVHRR